jgi:hypothetical protein
MPTKLSVITSATKNSGSFIGKYQLQKYRISILNEQYGEEMQQYLFGSEYGISRLALNLEQWFTNYRLAVENSKLLSQEDVAILNEVATQAPQRKSRRVAAQTDPIDKSLQAILSQRSLLTDGLYLSIDNGEPVPSFFKHLLNNLSEIITLVNQAAGCSIGDRLEGKV